MTLKAKKKKVKIFKKKSGNVELKSRSLCFYAKVMQIFSERFEKDKLHITCVSIY